MKRDGKVAFITGAASGIGHAIAKRYLEADVRVVIADLNADAANAVAKELASEKSAIGVGMDVSKEDQVNSASNIRSRRLGGLISSCRMPASRSSIRLRNSP